MFSYSGVINKVFNSRGFRGVKLFYLYFLGSLFILLISARIVYKQHEAQLYESILQEQKEYLTDTSHQIETIISLVISDLMVLKEYAKGYTAQQLHMDSATDIIQSKFYNFSINKPFYDQCRFIDKEGMERVRVNTINGKPVVIAKEDLQYKGERYYFTDVISLDDNVIFVSPLDLNIENGEIEIPHKPMIRIGTPVFFNGEKVGIVILNYIPIDILNLFGEKWNSGVAKDWYFLNSDGHQLKGPDAELDWNFMFESKIDSSFAFRYKQVWEKALNSHTFEYKNEDGLYVGTTIEPLSVGMISSSGSPLAFSRSGKSIIPEDYRWYTVSFLPIHYFGNYNNPFSRILLWALAMLAGIIYLMGFFLSRNIILNQDLKEQIELDNVQLDLKVKERTFNLRERVKELNCLYQISTIDLTKIDTSEILLIKAIKFIPNGFMNPDYTKVEIEYNGKHHAVGNSDINGEKRSAEFFRNRISIGRLTITLGNEISFLKEEYRLIDQIVNLIEIGINAIETRSDLQNANAVKDNILGSISHEILTPLNPILGFTATLIDEMPLEKKKEYEKYLSTIQISGRRLKKTVYNLHNASKIWTNSVNKNVTSFNLAALISSLISELKEIADEKNLEFVFSNNLGDIMLVADKSQVFTAIYELVDNAIQFTEKGTVSVNLKESPAGPMLIISDTGVGMNQEFMKSIHDPFSQESTGLNRKFEGLGLGMTVAIYFLKLNNIEFLIDSKPEIGTTIQLKFKAV